MAYEEPDARPSHAQACACRPIPKSIAILTSGDGFRRLSDLDGIGKAMLKDFDVLGIRSVEQLAKTDPQKLYDRLCRITGTRQDLCVLDTFTCAVAQARNPCLPKALDPTQSIGQWVPRSGIGNH